MRADRLRAIVDAIYESPTISEAAARLKISRRTVYRYLQRADVQAELRARAQHARTVSELRWNELLHDALTALRELLAHDDARTRLAAAREVFRVFYRPTHREEEPIILE